MFARVNLEADEYRLYETLFEIIYPNLPEPDVVIFLQAPIEKLRQQIRQRNRAYEQQIPDQYLMDLQEAYSALLKSGKFKTLVIDTTSVDFLNQPRQLDQLLDYLTQDYTYGYHLLSFS